MKLHNPDETSKGVEKAGFRPEEAAKYLGVSRATVFNLLKSGTLQGCKLGSATIIRRDHLDALLQGSDRDAQ